MKVAKIRKKEDTKTKIMDTSETYSIKSMIKILFIILLIFGIFYFVTFLLVKNRGQQDDSSAAVIDSTKITLSQLLNRNENEYYVIATKASLYDSSYINTNYIELYNSYINTYKQEEKSLPFYYVDLDSALNKKYISEESNIVNELSELKINDEILFKIKDGKIEKTYIGKDEILDKLSRL